MRYNRIFLLRSPKGRIKEPWIIQRCVHIGHVALYVSNVSIVVLFIVTRAFLNALVFDRYFTEMIRGIVFASIFMNAISAHRFVRNLLEKWVISWCILHEIPFKSLLLLLQALCVAVIHSLGQNSINVSRCQSRNAERVIRRNAFTKDDIWRGFSPYRKPRRRSRGVSFQFHTSPWRWSRWTRLVRTFVTQVGLFARVLLESTCRPADRRDRAKRNERL